VTSGAVDPKFTAIADANSPGGSNGYLAVVNPAASTLAYSTYLGGSISDAVSAMAYGAQDNAYLVGSTASPDFPITPNAFEIASNGGGEFITKINIDPGGRVLTRSVLTVIQPGNQSGQFSLVATVTPSTIASAEPILTGTVTFSNKGSAIGTASVGSPVTAATLATVLAATPASLGCSYSGDTYYDNSNCVVTPNFAIVLASPTLTVQSGQSITSNAALISIGGFTGTVTVNCPSIPAHLTCQITPYVNQLSPSRSTTDSIYLDTHSAIISARNRPSSPSPGQLALLLLPVGLLASRRLRRSRYAILGCAMALSLATLALSGCGREVYPYSAPAGTYTIPITASAFQLSGVITHTVQLTLIVTP
jgi:hypothetical protein